MILAHYDGNVNKKIPHGEKFPCGMWAGSSALILLKILEAFVDLVDHSVQVLFIRLLLGDV